MLARTLSLIVVMFACYGTQQAAASDCYRQLGIGYSAGYHAPAPFTQSSTCLKLPGWFSWKGACCQPGSTPVGCGCAPTPAPCSSCLPRLAVPCGPCGSGGCGYGGYRTFPQPGPGIY